MSWRWTRDAGTLTSTCDLCQLVITGRRDSDVTYQQRSHDAVTCQRRRAERARARAGVVYLAEPPKRPSRAQPKPERTHCANGHDWTPENVYINPSGHEKCRVCSRERAAAKYAELRQEKDAESPTFARVLSAGMGLGWTRMGSSEAAPDLTPEPPLDTPSRRSIK